MSPFAMRRTAKRRTRSAFAPVMPPMMMWRSAVIVDDGIAVVLRTDDDVLALLRVDVKGGIVQCPMCDRRLCALRRPRIDMELHLVLLAARSKGGDLVLGLRDAAHLCFVRRWISAARQMGECIEEQGECDADGEEARKALRVNFH